MGLFTAFRRNRHSNIDHTSTYLDIIRCLSDTETAEQFRACPAAPETWYHAHAQDYKERSVFLSDGQDTIIWIGMADHLLANGFAAELDYAAELSEFLDVIRQLPGTQAINEEWFDSMDNILDWCACLNEKWADTCLGAIDIDSDSYVLFVTSHSVLTRLKTLAKSIGKRIDMAQRC